MQQKSIHWAWIILAVSFANLFINYTIRLGYGVILPEMIQSLALSRTAGGTIYNSYLLVYLILTPFTGYLTDRLGARRVITVCSMILGIGTLFMGTVTSLWSACFAFAIVGVGATGMWTPVITLVQQWFAPFRRGMALGIMSTGFGLGFAAIGVWFPWIVQNASWRWAWYILGFGALAMILVNGSLLRSDPIKAGFLPLGEKGQTPEATVPHASKGSQKESRAFILRDSRFWLIGLSFLSISYALYMITTFMVDYAKFQLGLPLDKASLLATVHGFAQVVGVLTIVPLSDYLGRKKTIILSNSVITLCLVGILLNNDSIHVLFILIGLLGAFYGATFPMYGACGGDFFPRHVMGTVIGAWTPFYGLGAIVAHWVTGLLRDNMGVYDYGFAIGVIMSGVALILMGRVRKKPGS